MDVYECEISNLKRTVSFFDYFCLKSMLTSKADRKISVVKTVHHRKLKNLGIDLLKKVDVNKVIFNLSSRNISSQEKDVLTLGLDFCLKPSKANYF